jgi:magnesium chelatase family protein
VTKIYSVTGLLNEERPLITNPPIRSPHHSSSSVSLVGGGRIPRPGEISLAHRGILFLDEFPEFNREFIENLRQPLEDGLVTIGRASGTLTFPAKIILIAAMNPCPCGFFGHKEKQCICTTQQINNYQKKVSGPILDRIDLHLNVLPLETEELHKSSEEESSEKIRERVIKARNFSKERYEKSGIISNSELTANNIEKFCKLNKESELLLENAMKKFQMSMRSYHRIIKVARTIADLQESNVILTEHIAEAIQYRIT